ncbi:malic enzyme, NAD binding domain-containing protein [Phthorimaea operculella]|nr:malic enzyme, NAD binding domain-containing protein [Phthorimaea operculella]
MFSSVLTLQSISTGLRHSLPLFKINSPWSSGITTKKRYGDFIHPNMARGIDFIKDAKLNKGLAFTFQERQALGIHGLLAASYRTLEQQLEICRISIERYKEDLNKYLYLAELYETNERLYYTLLSQDVERYMPIIYTPTVGLACQRFGIAYGKPRGLFVSILDKGHILKVLQNWPEHDVRAICFTDGERILGLGDLGAYGMGISIGKLALYTVLAGIKPHQCLPVTLDVGTNNEDLITDPLYIGIRQKRVTGEKYVEFIDEFMKACVRRYGSNTLLQFEDFALHNATFLLERYRQRYCTFNDDIQGTASVAVAGLITAQRITKKKMSDNIYLFFGAGSAAAGIGKLCVDAMKEEGLSEAEAQSKIYMFDVDGLLSNSRDSGIPDHAKVFAKDMEPTKDFEKFVAKIKPTILIGASTVGGSFTPAILKLMARNTKRPIIFALSNPTPKAECTAQACYDNTEGRCVFASGSPFPPVQYGGKEYLPGQGNNAYIFPGVALGVIAVRAQIIPDKFFLRAAQALAKFVSENDLALGRIYPPLSDIQKVSIDIAVEVAKLAYEMDIAAHHPKPKDMKKFILNRTYSFQYPSVLPDVYDIPLPQVKLKNINELYPGKQFVQKRNEAKVMNFSPINLNVIDDDGCYVTNKAGVVKENEKLDVNIILKEVEKSKQYFDCWMFCVQFVYYYVLINPSL